MTEYEKRQEANKEQNNEQKGNAPIIAQEPAPTMEEEAYDPYSWADAPIKIEEGPETVESEALLEKEVPEEEAVFYFSEQDLPKYPPARALSEGAVLAALAAVLGLVAYYVPVVGMIATFVWPIPLSLLILRQGFGWGLLGTAITAVVLILTTGPLNGLLLLLNMAGVGLWYGYSFRKGIKPMKALAVGSVIAAISAGILVLLSNYIMGLPLMDIAMRMETMLRDMVASYQSSGLLNNLPAGTTVEEFTETILNMMKVLIPGAFVIASMAIAFISYFLTSIVFARLGYRRHHLPRFREWHLSWVFLWGLIIAFAGLLGERFLGYAWMKLVGMNVLYIYSPILIVCGIALLAWFWPRWQGSMLRFVVIIGLVLLFQYSLYALLMLGLIDTIFDIRKQIRAVEAQLQKTNKGGRH